MKAFEIFLIKWTFF